MVSRTCSMRRWRTRCGRESSQRSCTARLLVTRALITVGDEGQRGDFGADLGDDLVRHVPDRHSVFRVAKRVVIRYDADPPNLSFALESFDRLEHPLEILIDRIGHVRVRRLGEREAVLYLEDEVAFGRGKRGFVGRRHVGSLLRAIDPGRLVVPVAVERSVDVELGLDAELLLFGEVVRLLARLRFDFG